MWLLLIFGIVNYTLQIRAEDEKNTCALHEKWTVFQRRKYGNVDFFRGWDDYVDGFGDCDGDYWLGLETIHQFTKGGDMSLEINMMTKDKKDHLVAKYSDFRVGPRSENYTLHVSGFSGNDGDYLSYHNNQQFSTKDADHDDSADNCASDFEGGWWYSDCAGSNLNANFNKRSDGGFWWRRWEDRVGRRRRSCRNPIVCDPGRSFPPIYRPAAIFIHHHFLRCSEMKIYKRT